MKFSIFNYNKITGDKIIIFNTLTRAIIFALTKRKVYQK